VPKTRTVYVCDSCGNDSPKWEGRCPSCGEWNSMGEVSVDRGAVAGKRRSVFPVRDGSAPPATELSKVSTSTLPRLQVSSGEVNRVLGGGIVPGSMVLIAGDPGIGKSTLVLRMVSDVASRAGPAVFVTGEESMAQVKLRADRLGLSGRGVYMVHATGLSEVLERLEETKPALGVVDSIQTIYDDSLPSSAGSVAQIRECTRALMEWAKTSGVPLLLTGHVTKGGDIAGPRVLEHMVDVVLHLEGDQLSSWRLLRAVKNRYGSTNEVGVFEMAERGLTDVVDPSRAFLSERREGAVGSVAVVTLEGTRPLLVEVQALTSPSFLPAPRRVATGVELNRVLLVCAVLTRRAGISLAGQDVIVNVTGGLKIGEPAADLGIALAIVSSLRDVAVPAHLAAVGEIGLSGEVRGVPQLSRRIDEVARLGLQRCLVPRTREQAYRRREDGLDTVPLETVAQALAAAIPREGRRSAGVTDPVFTGADGP
jgi:DNA repair protein RadA/Sms